MFCFYKKKLSVVLNATEPYKYSCFKKTTLNTVTHHHASNGGSLSLKSVRSDRIKYRIITRQTNYTSQVNIVYIIQRDAYEDTLNLPDTKMFFPLQQCVCIYIKMVIYAFLQPFTGVLHSTGKHAETESDLFLHAEDLRFSLRFNKKQHLALTFITSAGISTAKVQIQDRREETREKTRCNITYYSQTCTITAKTVT